MHQSITHNFMLLLTNGAFGGGGEPADIQPMSPYKWRQLVSAATAMNVVRYISMGAEMLREEKYADPALFAALAATGNGASEQAFDHTTAHLFNHWTQKALEEVREEEMNAQDTSDETLILLDYIIRNAEYIITKDTSVEGIVEMGCYIRDGKDRIDYEKLHSWLSRIGLVQIASMEGNMLISCLQFSAEEIPFVTRPFPKARRLFMNAVENVFRKHSFSTMTRLNVAMLETISHRFVNAISMVTDIEE